MPLTPEEVWAALSPEERAAAIAGRSTTPAVEASAEVEAEAVPAAPQADDFTELDDFEDDTLALSYKGSRYVIAAPDIDTGMDCVRLLTGEKRKLSDEEESTLYVRLLGGDPEHPSYLPEFDVWAQLHADRRSWVFTQHVARTVIYWTAYDRTMALAYWQSGGRTPKAEPAAASPRAPQDHRTAGESTIRRRGSGSSTPTKPRKRSSGTPSGT